MDSRFSDYEWFLKEDLSAYFDKWVAILDKKIVAANKDAETVLAEVKSNYPNKNPLVTKIRSKISIL